MKASLEYILSIYFDTFSLENYEITQQFLVYLCIAPSSAYTFEETPEFPVISRIVNMERVGVFP